jgi:hypothetical protein
LGGLRADEEKRFKRVVMILDECDDDYRLQPIRVRADERSPDKVHSSVKGTVTKR